MKTILEFLLVGLLIIWFGGMFSVIVFSGYCTIFGYPGWFNRLFGKISPKKIARLFTMLALTIGSVALLLSVVNYYGHKK
ncbi:MAG TPA: hypothetical protein VKS19_03330 [Verrucomicrobiae bacterium]|nr:hypothetical protein [Verrucomicrobiae bacterium]